MTRLTRVVCDNPDCKSQIERYANDYLRQYEGMNDTPEGWYQLTYREPQKTDSAAAVEDPQQPRYFCSIQCVRSFTGEPKTPTNR